MIENSMKISQKHSLFIAKLCTAVKELLTYWYMVLSPDPPLVPITIKSFPSIIRTAAAFTLVSTVTVPTTSPDVKLTITVPTDAGM